MVPVLAHVSVFGVERAIGSYGAMMLLALLLASIVWVRLAARDGLDVGLVIATAALAIGVGFVGAHLLFVAVEWLRTGGLAWRHGRFGLVFFGGAFGGALGLWLAARRWGLPFRSLADHAAVALALGHALGRVGCVLGGCCFGIPWSGLDGHGLLSLTYTHALAPAAYPPVSRLPTPLLEALLVLVLLAVLLRWRARVASPPGTLALRYALGYAALRLCLERLRGDGVRGLMLDGMISTSQLLSLLVVVCVIALCAYNRWARRVGTVSAWRVLAFGLALGGVSMPHDAAKAQLTMQAPSVIEIGAGWFTMGSDDTDLDLAVELCRIDADRSELCTPEAFEDERPARRVYLSAYAIDRTEVSNASYRRCVAANTCAPQRLSDADPRLSAPAHPVTGVSFGEASVYCGWLHGSLPTEAQWEKAARGSNARRFPWGNLWNSRLANHGRGMGFEDPIDGYNYAAPVDAFVDARSPYGLLNMAGNVAEMTRDYYDERGYTELPRIDPQGPREGGERVVRGGSWHSPAFTLRTTHRTHMAESDTQADVGFRCAYAR